MKDAKPIPQLDYYKISCSQREKIRSLNAKVDDLEKEKSRKTRHIEEAEQAIYDLKSIIADLQKQLAAYKNYCEGNGLLGL